MLVPLIIQVPLTLHKLMLGITCKFSAYHYMVLLIYRNVNVDASNEYNWNASMYLSYRDKGLKCLWKFMSLIADLDIFRDVIFLSYLHFEICFLKNNVNLTLATFSLELAKTIWIRLRMRLCLSLW